MSFRNLFGGKKNNATEKKGQLKKRGSLLEGGKTNEELDEEERRLAQKQKRIEQKRVQLEVRREERRLQEEKESQEKLAAATEEKVEEVVEEEAPQGDHQQENGHQRYGETADEDYSDYRGEGPYGDPLQAQTTEKVPPPRPTTPAPSAHKLRVQFATTLRPTEDLLPNATPPVPDRGDEENTERDGEHLGDNIVPPHVEEFTATEEEHLWHPAGPNKAVVRERGDGFEGIAGKKQDRDSVHDFSQAKHLGSKVRGSSELHSFGGGGGYAQLDVEEGAKDTDLLLGDISGDYSDVEVGYTEKKKPTCFSRSLNALYTTLYSVGYASAYTTELIIINGLPIFLSETVGARILPEGLSPEVIGGLMTLNGAVNKVLGDGLNAAITPVVTYNKVRDYGRVKKQRVSGASNSFKSAIGREAREYKSAWRGVGKVALTETGGLIISFGLGAGVMGTARLIDWLATDTHLQSNMLDTSKSRLPIMATTGALAAYGYHISEHVYVIGMKAWSLRMQPLPKDAHELPSHEGKVKKFCREFTQDTGYGVLHVLTIVGAGGSIVLAMQAGGKHFDNAAIEDMARMVIYQFYATLAAEASLNLARFFKGGCKLNLGESRRPRGEVDLAGHEDDEGYRDIVLQERRMWQPTYWDMTVEGIMGVGHAFLCTAAGYAVTYFCLDSNNNNDLNIAKNGGIMETTMVATHIALNHLVYPAGKKLWNSCCSFFSNQTCNPTSRGYDKVGSRSNILDLGNETPTASPRAAINEAAAKMQAAGVDNLQFDQDESCLPGICCRP